MQLQEFTGPNAPIYGSSNDEIILTVIVCLTLIIIMKMTFTFLGSAAVAKIRQLKAQDEAKLKELVS